MKKPFEAVSGLSKGDSGAIKGVAVCLLLIHHLFWNKATLKNMDVQTFVLSAGQLTMLAKFAKICVPLFVFVTAYGISAKLGKEGVPAGVFTDRSIDKMVVRRLKALMIPYWYVFILAQIVCNITGVRNYNEIYCAEGGGLKSIVYFVTDLLGLSDLFGSPILNETWWYMPLALMLVFMVPVLYALVDRLCWIVLPAFFLVFRSMGFRGYCTYILISLLAIVMYRYRLVEKMQSFFGSSALRLAAFTAADLFILAVNCYMLSRLDVDKGWATAVFLCATFLIVALYAVTLRRIPYFEKVFGFMGKHSMNIFLTHTFIFEVFFTHFIYSFRYTVLIWFALLATSLILSVALDSSRALIGRLIPSGARS